ncbi:MAG: STAS/SEC14 domain-containing protein [Desulfobacterales bacterium]|nr:STAS/SEC14 domain-containing protein [Desulfobacterales bacterium]
MSVVRVETEIPFSNLLKAVEQLSLSDLEHLMNQVVALQARRKAPCLPKEEGELILKISQGLPSGIRKRFGELVARRQDETITSDEHQELLHLTDLIEKSDAERMKHISELSRIRGVPIEILMEELGINPPADA